ncbi:DSC E3 ubiquitin ligase complex subunit 4 [Madurella mycetomatis]|uniref:DSC E3 ubiquitin ligase complex subunit 4 n=1 Tax=Madurella mycetomatis TaxID=100816 RepID=A0A175WHB7_9PEZI|nr:DSC E3 ubiquitin ligase complex subunit 4 [Madurella mycetomatis]
MNDDPGPSSPARQPPPRPDTDTDTGEYGGRADEGGDGQPRDGSSSRRQDKRRAGLAKKLELVSHLQKSLDMMVFVYICTLYYMECSLARFLFRIVPHYSFLTPKDGLLLPAEHPHIYTIFVPTVLCMFAHTFFAIPQAGEATRGYLHGGVIIDFIGQKPPTTRLAFLFFDLVILGAQCLMLAVHQEREKLKKAVFPGLRTFSPSGDTNESSAAAETTQDHDAEERGVLRDEAYIADGGGMELQPLSGRDSNREGGRSPGDMEQSGSTYSSAAASVDMMDRIMSGNAVLSNFHVIHAVRSVGNGAQSATAYSIRTLGYNATLAALAAERRSRVMREQQR